MPRLVSFWGLILIFTRANPIQSVIRESGGGGGNTAQIYLKKIPDLNQKRAYFSHFLAVSIFMTAWFNISCKINKIPKMYFKKTDQSWGLCFLTGACFRLKSAVHVSWEFSQDSVKKATLKVRSLVHNVIFD